MAPKRVTVLSYGGDRNLWAGGPLTCRVIDLFGSQGPRVLRDVGVPPAVELDLDVPFDAGQAYGVSIDADEYRSGWCVINHRSFLRPDDGRTREVDAIGIRPMLVHKRAESSDLESAFLQLEGQGSPFAGFGLATFKALEKDQARWAFLNLEAKLRETWIDASSLLSFVRAVRAVAVDRVFILMTADARRLVERSPEFRKAPGHGRPRAFPGLPAHPDSWKHARFPFGNLQLSFSETTIPFADGGPVEHCYSVDADIDLERDLGHAFEFVHNQVFRKKTDQTLVYRMLWDQGILPAFTLTPPDRGAMRAARVAVSATGRGRRRSRPRRTVKRSRATRRR